MKASITADLFTDVVKQLLRHGLAPVSPTQISSQSESHVERGGLSGDRIMNHCISL